VTLPQILFYALADGGFHSGEALAKSAGVTRSAVWKAISQLRDLGLSIEAQTNRGYRLAQSCEPLSAEQIRGSLNKEIRSIAEVEVAWEQVSTNATLLESRAPEVGHFAVLFAENQSGGRGRRGRAWRTALGGSLSFSIATRFEPLPRDLPALTLAIGVCVRRALQDLGAVNLELKWPNDLVVRDGEVLVKTGGILVELRAEAGGPAHVVVGIGLNLVLDQAARAVIAATGNVAGDLRSQGIDAAARNSIAAAVVQSCIRGLLRFGREGFSPFIEEWREFDALRGRGVRISDLDGEREGVARGIDAMGALQVDTSAGRRVSIVGGDVSVRSQRT